MTTKYGNLLIPVTAGGSGVSLIGTCDPVLQGLGLAFKAILRTKLDAAWQAAAVQLKSQTTAHVVEDVYHAEPENVAKLTWQWPAIALWREGEKWTQRTLVYDSCESTLRCLYILPPLTREHYDRLAPIRRAVVAALRSFIENHGDASYTPTGGTAGADVLAALGVESLSLTDAEYGRLTVGEAALQMAHPAIHIKFDLRERAMPNTTGLAAMTRIDSDIESSDGTLTSDVVAAQFDPTTA